jgi:hypothetical protein
MPTEAPECDFVCQIRSEGVRLKTARPSPARMKVAPGIHEGGFKMRYLLAPIVLIAMLLASCASIPEPENESSSLVIGSLILDFPDGFFGETPRTLDSGVYVHVVNTTQGTDFHVSTGSGGYFYFLSNGTDHYSIEDYSFDERSTASMIKTVTLQGKIAHSFTASSRCVQYLGCVRETRAGREDVDGLPDRNELAV